MFIRRLTIERYRCIEHLEWHPLSRVNCLVGPGDAGKSTILTAIELVLDPGASTLASEFDYFRRRVSDGFEITAVLGDLDDAFLSSFRVPPIHGWRDRNLTPLPDEEGAEPVLVTKVSGSDELDVTHQLVTVGDAEDFPFSPSARRRLLLSRVATGGRAAAEFRLGRGSILLRHLRASESQVGLRSAAAAAISGMEIPPEAQDAISVLEDAFKKADLPTELSLGLITPQGWSLLRLVGLLSGSEATEAIPLSYGGSGTKQLALFRLAAGLMGESPSVLMDEPELGLEPYRQRGLIAEIRDAVAKSGQAFLTTHSPAVVESLESGEISRLVPGESPVRLEGSGIERLMKEVPDALLSRLPILCEGETEAGLLEVVLSHYSERDQLGSIDLLGLRIAARNGQPQVLDEAEELLKAGIRLGLFVDNEDNLSGRRAALAADARCGLGTWSGARNVEEAVAFWAPWETIADVVLLAARLRGRTEAQVLQQVCEAIGSPGTSSIEKLRQDYSDEDVREALAKAMLSKSNPWFKTRIGGSALGRLLLKTGLPAKLSCHLESFWARVRAVAEWEPKK